MDYRDTNQTNYKLYPCKLIKRTIIGRAIIGHRETEKESHNVFRYVCMCKFCF